MTSEQVRILTEETANDGYIANLNGIAREMGLPDPWEALRRTAEMMGLREVKRQSSCVLYRTESGRLVNCWIDAPSHEITEGGLGFDSQTEWLAEEGEDDPEAP